MLTYFALILTVWLSGIGLLKLSRAKIDWPTLVYLAPVLTVSMWSVLIGYGVLCGSTIKGIWPIGYSITVGLAIYGLFSDFRRLKQIDLNFVFLLVLLPLILMFPYFYYGIFTYMGSPSLDGWSHVAQGQFLWSYPRETEGGLAPLYQFSGHLAQNRFLAQALLGFLSPLTGLPGDTRAGSGLFLALCFFVFASSILFFASSRRIGRRLTLFYVVSAILSAWMVNLLRANNYDNTLAISFLPALAGVQGYLAHDDRGQPVLLALLAAAAVYIYPEMMPLVLGFAALFVLQKILASKLGIKKWGVFLCAAVILFLVFSLPTLQFSFKFLIQQLGATKATVGVLRPGQNMFAYLLVPYNWMANMWGLFVPLKLEYRSVSLLLNLIGLLCSALAVVGLISMVKRGDWGIAFFVVAIWFGALFMVLRENYDYGAYKILNMGWWASSFTVFAGVTILRSRWHSSSLHVAVAILLVFFLTNTGLRIMRFDKLVYPKNVTYYQQVLKVKDMAKGKPVLVFMDNVFRNQWSVYFLRDFNILVHPYRGYMAQKHVRPFMDKARKPAPDEISYLLTDSRIVTASSGQEPVWNSEKFKLWDVGSLKNDYVVYCVSTSDTTGAGNDGEPVLIGRKGISIDLWSGEDGRVTLDVKLDPVQSVSATQEIGVLFSTNNGFQKIVNFVGNRDLTVELPVRKYENRIQIKSVSNENLHLLGNGNARQGLFRVTDLNITRFFPEYP